MSAAGRRPRVLLVIAQWLLLGWALAPLGAADGGARAS